MKLRYHRLEWVLQSETMPPSNSSVRTLRVINTRYREDCPRSERPRITLRWRHNGHDCVSNHQPRHCLLNRLFERRSKKTSKLRVTGLCAWNSPGTGEFPAQIASNAVNVSIWWRHHGSAHPGRTWAPWCPTKRRIFCWGNAVHSTQSCILTKFRFVIKSAYAFMKYRYLFIQGHFMHRINALASRESRLEFQFPTIVSSNVCRIQPSAWFLCNLLEMTCCIYIHENLSKFNERFKAIFFSKMANTFTWRALLISVHNDRHLSSNGIVTMGPITVTS